MKNYLTVLALLLVVNQSCVLGSLDSGITGNGNVIEKEREIESFHGLHVANGIDVYITQSDKEDLLLIADENLHDVITTDVENGILKIKSKENIRKATTLKIELNYKSLDEIKISSAGDVVGKTKLDTDDLKIHISSSGDLKLEIEANSIECKISSSGDAKLSGITQYFDVVLSSSGDLSAYDLITEDCRVRASSSGNAKVYATKSFDLEASSAGDIYYKGDGKVENLKTSSAGSIKKQD